MEASTQKLLLLCDGVDLVCAWIPEAAAAERAAGAVHALSLPHVSPISCALVSVCWCGALDRL